MRVRNHLFNASIPICSRCGLSVFQVRELDKPFCMFSFIPKTDMGSKQGWPRMKREAERLHKRGLIKPNEILNIVKGHVRPWPRRK